MTHPIICQSFRERVSRRSTCGLTALFLSGALSLPSLAPGPALADGKAALEIQAATRDYKQARQSYEETSSEQSRTQIARNRERTKYLNDWATIWEKKRLGDTALRDLRQAFAEDNRALKDEITDLKSAREFADMEVKSRNDRLLGLLHALRDAQSGSDKALINTLVAETDLKRNELRAAETALDQATKALTDAEQKQANRQAAFDTETARIKEETPTLADVRKLEQAYGDRLDDIGHLPLPEKLEDLATTHENAAEALLATLLKNQPAYVKRIDVSFDGKPWYMADIVEDPNGTPDPQSAELQKATRDALENARMDLEDLDHLLKVASREMDRVQLEWKDASERAGHAQVSIILRDRDMAAFTLVAESTAVVITSVATGGLATPAAIGFIESLSAAGSRAWKLEPDEVYNALYKWAVQGMDEGGLRKLLSETGDTHRGKKWSEVVLGGPTGTENLLGLNTYQSIAVGDYLEFTFANWNKDVKSFLPKGAEATTAGIALTTTAAKMMAQKLTDIMKDKEQQRAFQNTLKAALEQKTYMRLAAARRALKIERDTVAAQISALEKLRDHGLLPRKLEVRSSKAISHDEAAKIGRWEVRVTFSEYLDHAPELASFKQGVTFDRAQRSDSNPAEWIFEVNGFDIPESQSDIQLVVSINPGEPPYSYLDAEPQTPTFPASLTWHEVKNYEQGSDVNHRLMLKPDGITLGVYSLLDPAVADCAYRDIVVGSKFRGEGPALPTISEKTPTYDVSRQQEIQPFGKSDPIIMCVDQGTFTPRRDAAGRYIIAATHPRSIHQYSNGYAPPHFEELDRMRGVAIGKANAASAANEEAMFGEEALERQRLQMEKGMFIPPAPQ
ncbi:hypothetical protein J7481_06745 [Labrenzia sp. R4_2]|uniref:hypothetical protein n=1 Tax=Labrenzia sp. R4_2 TaxID=2821107 RepID=UPI001ADB1634|nr:hypothetical protein [Labrenzia sp. R4_2]MBO9419187.1 hypothetical protein [Labrenzia sp. R4_2]